MEHMYVLRKTSVCSVKKVRTFSRKSTDVFIKKYGHFFQDGQIILYIINYQTLTKVLKNV